MSRAVNSSAALQSKLEQIRSGTTKKTDLGVKENKGVIHGKSGKFVVVEKEKKFEEAGVKRKKRNYVMYESKLGTEKNRDLKKIEEPKPAPKPKPKPKVEPKPRVEEKIIQKKKRLEYLDNYQYHETKNIKNPDPKRVSIVSHQRLGDIVGGVYEESTYQRQTMTDSGRGPKLLSTQTTKTTSRRGPQGQPQKSTQRTISTSRTMPAQSREYRQEKKFSSNTTRRSAPPKEQKSSKTTTTTTRTTTTTTRSRGAAPTTSTTTTKKVVTRGGSAPRGRRH
jgi:hypothetical protein